MIYSRFHVFLAIVPQLLRQLSTRFTHASIIIHQICDHANDSFESWYRIVLR